jgi:hypothetical protein
MDSFSILQSSDTGPAYAPVTPAPEEQRKKPGVAFVLSLVFPGLGHWYCGKRQSGGVIAAFSAGALALVFSFSPASQPIWWGIGLRTAIVLYGFAFLDAFYSAREINAGVSDYVIGNNPRVAAMLNLLTSGFGYFYLGERTKGLILFVASRALAMTIGVQAPAVALAVELISAGVAIDAHRIARRKLREILPTEAMETFASAPQSGLSPLVPITLAAIFVFNYAALICLGFWMPRYRPIDRTAATMETNLNGTVYSNAEYGFEVSVPPDWKIDERSQTLIFRATEPDLGCQVGFLMEAKLPLHGKSGIARTLENQVRSRSPSYQWLSEGQASLGNKEAYALKYQVTNSSGVPILQRIIFLHHNLTLYSFMETSLLGTAVECQGPMDEIAKSVKLDF